MTKLPSVFRLPIFATAALVFASVTALGSATANATTVAKFAYQGSAYGTTVQVGSLVTSGRSAAIFLGCSTLAPTHNANSSVGVTVPSLLSSGTVATTADTFASPVAARTTAATQRVNLLNGLVTGDTVQGESTTTFNGASFAVSSAGTNLVNLVVAGHPITATPAPNTRIDLAGFGYVMLNEQSRSIGLNQAVLSVNAIHLFITATNPLGIVPGTTVIISHADSALGGPVAGVLGGFAYGSFAAARPVASSGPSFLAVLPCLGTNGVLRTNTGAGVTVSTLLTTGTITDTAKGTVTATAASGETTSTVQSAAVLSNLVQATVVKADAHSFSSGTTLAFGDTGSTFATLSVKGFPLINPSVARNTQLTVPGIGTLYLHRVVRTANSIEVRMIELVLTSSVNGFPIGTDIRVAVANAQAH